MAKFTGADGSVWGFHFHIPQIAEFMDMMELCLGDLENDKGFQDKIKQLKMSQMVDAIWLLAQGTADKRNITKDQFFTEILKPHMMGDAIQAFYAAFTEAFDTGEPGEKGAKKKKGPLESGVEKT